MASPRSLSVYAFSLLGAAQSVLALKNPISRANIFATTETCSNPQLSCHNTTAVANTCCFEYPGGTLLQTQFWDGGSPSYGPTDSWTIHGLWPDYCDGSYGEDCDASRAYTNITEILQAAGDQDLLDFMNTYWVSDDETAEAFWEHEWETHGTCISTLDPSCFTDYKTGDEVPYFFNTVVTLFKRLTTYEWLAEAGIVPSNDKTYTSAEIQAALSKNNGGFTVYLDCEDDVLSEVYYFFNVLGPVQSGDFEPTDSIGESASCPDSGISYPPKASGTSVPLSTASPFTAAATTAATTSAAATTTPAAGTTTTKAKTTATTATASPTATGTGSVSGSGYLTVFSEGSQNGCIISYGTWYTTGTCATFTATASGDGFTLTSSKGLCEMASGELSCSSSVDQGTVFTADGDDNLLYDGSSAFSAGEVPTGSTQADVYSGDGHSAAITIQWQSK